MTAQTCESDIDMESAERDDSHPEETETPEDKTSQSETPESRTPESKTPESKVGESKAAVAEKAIGKGAKKARSFQIGAVPLALGVLALALAIAVGVLGYVVTDRGNTIDTNDLESQLTEKLSADAGVDPAKVSVACPDDEESEKGNKFDCTLTAPNGDEVTVNVTITDDEGGYDAVVPPQNSTK